MTSLLVKVKTSLLAFVAALCLQPTHAHAQTPAPQAASWERYAFPGDEFSVELPGMPSVFHTRRCISRGCRDEEKVRVFGYYADGVIFVIVAFDKPRQSETPEDFLSEVSGGGPYAPTPKKVAAGRLEGLEYRSAKGAARLFKTKTHAYLFKAFAREGSRPSVERFLDSLTLSDRPQGREIKEANAPAHVAVAPPPVVVASPPGTTGPGAASVDYDRVFSPKEVTSKAVIVYKGDPGFTEEARQNNVTGVVRLRLVLTSAGRVADISVVKGLPDGLTERAIYAARHALFFPARKDGRDVSQYVTFEYYFNIYVE